MIEQLFGSKTRAKLLQLFLSNPNRSFYVREITRKIDEQINSVRRELANLLNIGIITSDTTNNKLYYEVNQQYEYYQPLAEIFGGKKVKKAPAKKAGKAAKEEAADTPEVVVVDHPLLTTLNKAGHVALLVFTGQFTRDESAGVDVLVVGDLNQTAFAKAMSEYEASENKELRYALFGVDEFLYRRQINDRFITDVLLSKKQIIVDNDGLITLE